VVALDKLFNAVLPILSGLVEEQRLLLYEREKLKW